MKKRFNFVTAFALAFTLLFSSISSISASAAETGEKVSTDHFVIDGNNIEYQTVVNKDTFKLKVTGDNGYIYLTKVDDKVVDLKSDFLNNNELKQMKNEINSSIENLKQDDNTDISIAPMAMTGDWANGAWRKYTVSASGKVTAEIIVSTIGGVVGNAIGAIAGGLAAIMIENNVKTGYFKIRNEYRNDTVLGYYWERIRVNVYKDSARTKLLGSKVTKPVRYAPPSN